jgi:3-methylcrotonyl-CoA carboxylase alpha subunit
VKCNAGFLNLLLYDEDFEAGRMDTGLIAAKLGDFIPDEDPSERVLQSVAHMVIDETKGGKPGDIRQTYLTTDPGPWSNLGLRLNRDHMKPTVELAQGTSTYVVTFEEISIDEAAWVEKTPDGYLVDEAGVTFMLTPARHDAAGASAHDGDILAPMPGKVIAVDVTDGQQVEAGQRLMVLEAMKMEHALTAPFAGTVAELAAREGQQVQVEALLARVVKAES